MPWEFPRITDWIEAAEPWAYGPLELKPGEFASLSPREFELLCAGYTWRTERRWDEIAWQAWIAAKVAGAKDVELRAFLGGREFGESLVRGYRVRR